MPWLRRAIGIKAHRSQGIRLGASTKEQKGGKEVVKGKKKKASTTVTKEKKQLLRSDKAFMANAANLAAMKLTELGSPTLPNAGFVQIAIRIKEINPKFAGLTVRETIAAFVEQGEEAKRLSNLIRDNKAKRNALKYGKKPTNLFYDSDAWRGLRYQVLRRDGGKCVLCGVTAADGAQLHVDHIKPRSLFPELELEINNLQVLCSDCNLGKSNTDQIDWRRMETVEAEKAKVVRHLRSIMHEAN